jgi:hypothetical protein
MSSDSLDQFFAISQRLRDCLKIAGRAVNAVNVRMLQGTEFLGQPRDQAARWVEETRKAVDDLSVVAFWALFERQLIEYTQERMALLNAADPVEFAQPLREKVEAEIEGWRPSEILDLFKALVDPNQIGIAKQIKGYRYWVAHRNPRRPPSAQAEPTAVYRVLFAILDELGRIGAPAS